jgi:hypothetical protein
MDFLKEQNPQKRQRLREETIDDLINVAEDCFCGENSDYSLAFANSILSLLALLISEEFDDLLKDTYSNEINKIVVFSLIDQHHSCVQSHYTLSSVRVFDEMEKKIFCEPVNPGYDAWRNLHAKQRIILSIDPYISPEDAARIVTEVVKQWQKERFSEDQADWMEDGFSDEQAEELARRDLLDYHRSPEGKRSRSGSTFFSVWLRRLRVYREHRKGYTYDKISQLKWFGGDDKLAWRDSDKAKQFVESALRGIPIFSMK